MATMMLTCPTWADYRLRGIPIPAGAERIQCELCAEPVFVCDEDRELIREAEAKGDKATLICKDCTLHILAARRNNVDMDRARPGQIGIAIKSPEALAQAERDFQANYCPPPPKKKP